MPRTMTAVIAFCLCSAVAGCEQKSDDSTGPEPTEGASLAVASNTWTIKHSLSPWRRAMAAGTINGIVYVAGGIRLDSRTLSRVDAYNVATNTWSQMASMPGARAEPNGASMISGKLYVTGGRNANGVAVRTLFVYDPGTNTWSRKADIPQVGCSGTQGVIGGQLYAYTGCFAELVNGVFFRYDPATNTWLRRATPPTDHSGGAGGVINGRFYLVGGYKILHCSVNGQPSTCSQDDNAMHVYNPATNSWTSKALIPVKLHEASAVVLGGKLYVVGGETEFGSNDAQVYDPASNTWSQKAALPQETYDGAAAVAGGKIVFLAGVDDQQPVFPGPSKVYVYTP
jgi:N-acetylneuraminic acid mutarotase